MDYITNAWTSTTSTASDYWSKRPTWLGGPEPVPAVVGGRRKTRRHRKSTHRRTGRRSSDFLGRLFRM